MKILFCDPVIRKGELRGCFAHIYEVSSNLTKLGHNLVLLKVIQPHKQQLPLWVRVDRLSNRIPVIGTIIAEIYTFMLVFFALVRHRGRFDIIYRRHNAINSEYLLSRLFRIPFVKEVNGLEAEIQEDGDSSSIRARIVGWLERFTMPKADRIIVVTHKLRETLHLDYGIPESKIFVIENGANVDLFKPMNTVKARQELNLNQDDYYVCLVGSNLLSYQGTGRLIGAAPFILERLPDVRFLVVGGSSDSEKQEVIKTVKEAGLADNFIFTGLVPYERVPFYINASDACVVLPSIYLERAGGSPLKLCEYMACNKPVVTSRRAEYDIVGKANAGLLVDPENPEEVAGAIAKLLENKELRGKMGKNGRRYVVENRSWEIVAEKTVEVCREAVQEKKRRGKRGSGASKSFI